MLFLAEILCQLFFLHRFLARNIFLEIFLERWFSTPKPRFLRPNGPGRAHFRIFNSFQKSSEFSEFSEYLDAQIFFRNPRRFFSRRNPAVFLIGFHASLFILHFHWFFSRNRYQPRFFSRNRYQPRNPKNLKNPSAFSGVPLKIRISKRVLQNFSLPP